MKSFFSALSFLTILPIPQKWVGDASDLAKGVLLFPLVALIIATVLATLAVAVSQLFPPLVASVLIVITMICVSGAFHLDGLSDTADGFLSSRPRERILEIMKDSRVGPMGVIAIVAVFALKVAAFASLPAPLLWRCTFISVVAGRCSMVLVMARLPYARSDGLGAIFFRQPLRLAAFLSVFVLGACSWLLTQPSQTDAVLIAGSVVLATLLLCRYSYAKIGGATGDVCGATCELIEILPPLIMSALQFHPTR